MTAAEFKEALHRLGRTQIGFAQEIGVSRRTVHLWAERGPPAYAINMIGLIDRLAVSAKPMNRRDIKCPAPEPLLDDMYAQAASEGEGQNFLQAIESWLESRAALGRSKSEFHEADAKSA